MRENKCSMCNKTFNFLSRHGLKPAPVQSKAPVCVPCLKKAQAALTRSERKSA